MTTNDYVILAIAAYFVLLSMICNTTNLGSTLVFKVFPFFSAVYLALVVFKLV